MMSTVSDDPISLWLRLGALEKLEQVLLDGYGKQLYGKTSRIPEVNKFLKQIPVFQAKIEEIHRAVVKGQLREVQHLIDRKKLAFSRDHMGASTLHKAVLYEQTEIMEYLLDRYSSVIHARDHQGRTPLHYAAVLQDDGKIYNMLLEAGADQKATDMHGHRPDYYLQNQGELTLQQLKEGAVINRAKRLKPKPQPKLNVNDSYRGFSAKPAGNKVQIKELIDQGSLETLEELLLQGHGDKLLGETSNNERIQEFLTMVPIYMERINEIHRAVVRGRLRDVQSLLDRKNLAMGRDQLGATPLHKAVMYGHFDIAEYIVNNYPACRDCKDVDGHTALHYASVLPDGKQMYNMLIGAGVNPGIPDGKGKPSEYYLQYPEQLNLTQLIKRSQRANANFIANTANRFLSKHSTSTNPVVGNSGQKRRFLTSNNVKKVTPEVQGEDVLEEEEESKDHLPSLFEKRTLFGTRPQVPIPQLQRLDVTSANIRKWVQDEDLDKLEGAVIEGYGEKLIHVETSSEGVQTYINETVPKIIERIEAIHAAVAEGNISELQSHLDKQNFALAKDHMGMTPLHRAVILGHMDVVKYILEKFPETVNAKDKDGRTALHYAAAVPRKDGKTMFKMLLQAGADIRIRDQHGRTPEYYRTHHLSNNFEHSKAGGTVNQVEKIIKDGRKGQVIPKMVIEKTNKALLNGDVAELHEIAGDGYGHYLLGKTSWHENVRQYLKELPGLLESNASVQQALRAGDVEIVKEHVTKNEQLLNFRDENGEMVVHQAITHNQFPILQFLVDQFPQTVKHRDRGGRTGLHIAAIQKNEAAYELLLSKGGDPKVLDQKGRTAEYYLKSGQKSDQTMNRSFKVVSQGQQELSNTIRAEAEGQEESNDVPEAAAEGQEELNDVPEPGAEGEEESNDVSVVAAEEQEESNDVPEAETEGQEESNDVPDAGAEGQEESNDAPEVSAEGQDESNDVPDAGAEGVEESNDVPEAAAEGEEESNDVPEAETEGQEESNGAPESGAEGQEESNDAPEPGVEREEESNGAPEPGAEGQEESNDVPGAETEGQEESNDFPKAASEEQGEPSHEGTSEEPNEAHRSTDSSKQNEYLKTLIDNWIEEADLMRLEHVIIAGQGDKLIGRSSDNKQVQEFLDLVPAYMARIRGVHEAVVRGSLTEVKQVITRKRFALSRDHLGASPLHLAVLHGHSDVMAYIISQFPETMDGPDNEGRTPLHYAAVVPDGGKYFSILIHAGADNGVKDKYGRIPQDYLDQPDLLTIRDLLEGYKITENLHRKPSIVEVWHRPPTQEIEQNLTPVYSDEEESPLQAEQTTAEALIFPLLTTASEEDNQYLLDTVADVLVAGIREVSLLKPRDPIAYLATWLYSYASHRASRDKGNQSDNMTPEFEKVLNQQTRNLQSRMKKLTATANLGQRSENLEFLEEEKEDDEENSIEIEDQTKMKDEAGQTVLHFAAVQTHQNDSFYNLIVQTEILLAERDVNYSTARDIAEQSGYLENVQTIDQYVIDAFIDGNAGLLHMLMHEGYDHLLNVTDKKGKDIKTILEENNLQKSLSLLTDLAEFEKKREELHTYIRNSYVEGISNLSKQDRSLVTAKNTKGRCSLHVAVLLEKLNIIKILVDVNASSVHVPDNMGRTPLHYAMATVSVTQIARVLIEAGALRTTQDVKMHSVSYYYINGEDIQKLMEEEENQSS